MLKISGNEVKVSVLLEAKTHDNSITNIFYIYFSFETNIDCALGVCALNPYYV